MDQTQQALVRSTFAKIEPMSDQAAAMFYDRLFAIDPDLRPMFKNDMKKQGAMLMAVLATAVGNLHRSTRSCRRCANWGGGTPATASRTRTTTRSPLRFFRRSRRRWAMNSRPRSRARGSLAIRRWPAR